MQSILSEQIILIHPVTRIILENFKSISESDRQIVFEYTINDIEKRMGKITFFKTQTENITIGLTLQQVFDELTSKNEFEFKTESIQEIPLNYFSYVFQNNNLVTSCINSKTNLKVYSSEMNLDILRSS